METLRHAVLFASVCEEEFKKRGIAIRTGNSARELANISQASGRGFISKMFDPSHVDILSRNLFWCIGRISDEVVFTIAMRFDDLGETTLAEYWSDQFARLYPGADRAATDTQSILHRISGSVAYAGELWVSPKFQDDGLDTLAAQYVTIMSYLAWYPDWVVALAPDCSLRNGSTFREGFTHAEALLRGHKWAPDYIAPKEYLAWMTQHDMRIMLARLAEDIGS